MKSKLHVHGSILLLSFLAGCGGSGENRSTSLSQFHPVEQNIPYIDEETIPVSSDPHPQPEAISNGGQSSSGALRDLGILVDTQVEFRYVSEEKTRGLILDIDNSTLYEYHFPDNEVHTLAQFGQGPGDLFAPKDIAVWDEQVFIPGVDGLISIFECGDVSPCQYQRSIDIGFVAQSIAATEDRLYVLGTPDGVLTEHPIHVLDKEGNLLDSFGEIYDAESPMVKENYSEGRVKVDPERNLIYMIFQHFPMVYVFNDNFELDRIYQFENFEYLAIEARTDSEGSAGTFYHMGTDYDLMLGLNRVGNGELLVRILNRNRVEPSPGPLTNTYSHYRIDDNTGEGTFLGEFDYQVLAIDEQIFLNRDGSILMIDSN